MRSETAWGLAQRALVIGNGWSDEASYVLAEEFEKLEDSTVLGGVVEGMMRWSNPGHPPIGEFLLRYEEALLTKHLDRARRLPGTDHCDGSGFVRDATEGEIPCFRCNPILWEVHEDRDKWARWRQGTPLHVLHDDVELRKDKNEKQVLINGRVAPPPCRLTTREDPLDPVVDLPRAYAVAADAYRDECRARGGEPDWDKFNRHMGPLLKRHPNATRRTNPPRPSEIRSQPPRPQFAPASAAPSPPPPGRPLEATDLLSEAIEVTRQRMEEQ